MAQPEFNPLDTRANDAATDDKSQAVKTIETLADEDLRWIMGDKRGRRFVWGSLARAGVFTTSMTGNSWTFFKEGERNQGLFLLAAVNRLCPDLYVKMVKESKENQ